MTEQGGNADNMEEVVCNMSPAFLAGPGKEFPEANVTVDWFHVMQKFTTAVDAVSKAERKQVKMPTAIRRAVLKSEDSGKLADTQTIALPKPEDGNLITARAWRTREKLR